MSKAGESVLRGAREALAYARGERGGFAVHVPERVDVKAVRKRIGLSQENFAARFGFTLDSVRNWEQGRREPEQAARALLTVIKHDPEAVIRALSVRSSKETGRAGRAAAVRKRR